MKFLWTTEHFVLYILLGACVCVKVEINSYWNVCLTLYLVTFWCKVARYINNLNRHRKEDRQLIFTTETDSFLSNPEMKAHCEAVWNKFNTLTNNNLQSWPCLHGCALLAPIQQRISDWVIALVRPIFLICCTTLSAPGLCSLWTLLSTDQERKSVLIIPFPLGATKQYHAFSEGRPKRSSTKIPAFLPPLPCPHVGYPLPLWSSSSSNSHHSMVLQCNS